MAKLTKGIDSSKAVLVMIYEVLHNGLDIIIEIVDAVEEVLE